MILESTRAISQETAGKHLGACRIESERELSRSAFLGQIFEGYVAAEIIKSQINLGKRRELYSFRDQRGLEVDFLAPLGSGNLLLVEAKASRTVCIVVHGGKQAPTETALTEGALSMDVSSFVRMLHEPAKTSPRRRVTG